MNTKRRIGIDVHTINGVHQGTRTAWLNVIPKLDATNDYILYSYSPSTTKYLFPQNQFIHRKIKIKNPLLRIPFILPIQVEIDKCDLLHVNYFSPLLRKGKVLLTIHDLIYLDFPQYSPGLRRLQFKFLGKFSAKIANQIMTVSEYSKDRIMFNYNIPNEKVVVIPNALDNNWIKPDLKLMKIGWSKIKKKLPKRYILTVGRLDPRKNMPKMARITEGIIQSNLTDALVIVGPDDFGAKSILEKMKKDRTYPHVIRLHDLSIDEIQAVYKNAQCLLYLSLAEGFGYPLIEAMSMQTPIVASNRTAIPEICGDAAIIVDPDDEKQVFNAVSSLLLNSVYSTTLSAKGKKRVNIYNSDFISQKLNDLYTAIIVDSNKS